MITHWKLSEGNIEIIEGEEDKNRNLLGIIDFYKHKIEDLK